MAADRTRAWILVQADPPQGVPAKLRKLDRLTDDLVVIRADLVAESPDFPYNIIVPVDAESEDVLAETARKVEDLSGVSKAVVVKVKKHSPTPPHDAHGYVTKKERDKGKDKELKPGRQKSESPGANPWG